MGDHLHIVCLDAPSPSNYGGAIEMNEKIRALALHGWKIHLHYFSYKANRNASGLEGICDQIFSYRRTGFFTNLRSPLPYIVRSRMNSELISRLRQDQAPVLLEGLHNTGIIPYIGKRNILLRMHNNEAAYYKQLALSENRWLPRWYLMREAALIDHYQQQLAPSFNVATLSPVDRDVLSEKYDWKQVSVVPAFHPWKLSEKMNSRGTYALYHGNLSVKENESAALWLVDHVFRHLNNRFIIAGQQPGSRLKDAIAPFPHIELVADPDEAHLEQLIRETQLHVLPSMNVTGVKLKLLHALFHGRFCLTNPAGVAGSMLEDQVRILRDPTEWQEAVTSVMEQAFGVHEMKHRLKMQALYDNKKNAEMISALL